MLSLAVKVLLLLQLIGNFKTYWSRDVALTTADFDVDAVAGPGMLKFRFNNE